MIEQLLTAKALASRIGVTEGCLAKWRMTGEGPSHIRVMRRIMYDPADVAAWLDARRVGSTSEHVVA
ncbi:MAG: helix-turn-helix domain-containing protein [Pseudomonadota bacterium]